MLSLILFNFVNLKEDRKSIRQIPEENCADLRFLFEQVKLLRKLIRRPSLKFAIFGNHLLRDAPKRPQRNSKFGRGLLFMET